MQTEIRFSIDSALRDEYAWVLRILGKYAGFTPVIVDADAEIVIAEHGMGNIQVSHFFRQIYQSGDYHQKAYFRKEPLHRTASGKPDYLSTCFYLLAFVQEYTDYVPDQYNRFPYAFSLQQQYQCAEHNLVAEYFKKLIQETPALAERIQVPVHKSQFFLSHDIDTVYGALAQNGKYLLRNGRIGALLQLIFNHYTAIPDQLLLNRIMDIENEYDVRSVFFWLTRQGRATRKINNADYFISDAKVRMMQNKIHAAGWLNGLHKSASKDSYQQELVSLGEKGMPFNRNHYLITELPDTFNDIEAAGIQLDATMGFPDVIGFRNSYGLPYQPWHLKEKRPYRFVEVPLTIMDSTLRYYMHQDAQTAERTVLNFLDKHKTDAVISVLWHNNYFTDMVEPGWLQLYKSVLQFIKDSRAEALMPAQIIEKYSN